MDDQLYCNPDLAQFYDIENSRGPDFEYCEKLADDAQSVLDLGCGTGQFLADLSGDKRRVGIDPAGAMLDIARTRTGGGNVTWVEADARSVRLDQKFELIILTGHAFQVFLTEVDQRAVLATIANHLTPNGRFIFDSRSPDVAEWRDWQPTETDRKFEHPGHGTIRTWNSTSQDQQTGVVTYQSHYEIVASGQVTSASSDIVFTPKDQIAAMIGDAGLIVDTWYGDWQGTPWQPEAIDIIPFGTRR